MLLWHLRKSLCAPYWDDSSMNGSYEAIHWLAEAVEDKNWKKLKKMLESSDSKENGLPRYPQFMPCHFYAHPKLPKKTPEKSMYKWPMCSIMLYYNVIVVPSPSNAGCWHTQSIVQIIGDRRHHIQLTQSRMLCVCARIRLEPKQKQSHCSQIVLLASYVDAICLSEWHRHTSQHYESHQPSETALSTFCVDCLQ